MKWSNKEIRKWLRILHRDIGYLMVGLSIIYGISGYILNHIDGTDPAFKKENKSITLAKDLTRKKLLSEWNLLENNPKAKTILKINEDHYRLMLDGGVGIYEVHSGRIDYQLYSKKPIIYFFNKLHYNKVKYWTWISDIFAFTLVFFALSGLFLVKGPKGIKGRGKWYLIAGILIPLLFLLWM